MICQLSATLLWYILNYALLAVSCMYKTICPGPYSPGNKVTKYIFNSTIPSYTYVEIKYTFPIGCAIGIFWISVPILV